jgi:phosphoserine aminotransferase
MYERVYNFNAGPAVMPESVLERARDEMLNFDSSGMSVMEMSHRSKEFETILHNAESQFRKLMGVPADYTVLFLQGGASLQFLMVSMNLRPSGSADYVLTGYWSKKACEESKKVGSVHVVASSEESGFDRIPKLLPEILDPNAAFLHITSNETIEGIRWRVEPPTHKDVPLVCDMSSNIASQPVDVSKYGLIYAGAQKNLGPAGVTVVVVRNDLLERSSANLPAMLNYKLLAKEGSLYNTPPTHGIYMVGLVLNWLIETGGLEKIGEHNKIKSGLVYEAIDNSGGFYRGYAQPQDRSIMNATFMLDSDALTKEFIAKSEKEGFVGLKGHRSIGGVRASLYNALPVEAVEGLVQFMREFQRTNG